MSIKYFIKDKIIFFRHRIYLMKDSFKDSFKIETKKVFSIPNLFFLLMILVVIRMMKGFSVIVLLILIYIIRYYYKEWKGGEHRGWGREKKFY